jgi:hypothetical protein
LKEARRLGIFEKRDEVTADSRKLYNEELHNLYPSSSIIRMFEIKRMDGQRM